MDAVRVAWLAGLFEGEGCLHRRADGGGYELVIVMTDQDVVRRCLDMTGRGTVVAVPRARPHWADKWRWRVGRRDDIAELLRLMIPHLGERRRLAADEFLTWYEAGAPVRRTAAQRARSAAYMRSRRRQRMAQYLASQVFE